MNTPVDRQQSIVDPLPLQPIHEGHVVGIARGVDLHAIDFDEITHAFLGVVVLIPRRNGTDIEPVIMEVAVDAVAEGVFAMDDDGPRAHWNKVDRVVIVMLVGHQNQVGLRDIAFSGIRVDIKNPPFGGGDA